MICCNTETIHKEYNGVSLKAIWDICPKCKKEYNRGVVNEK